MALCCIYRKHAGRRSVTRDLLTRLILTLIPNFEKTPVLTVNGISDRLLLRALPKLLRVFEKGLDQVFKERAIGFCARNSFDRGWHIQGEEIRLRFRTTLPYSGNLFESTQQRWAEFDAILLQNAMSHHIKWRKMRHFQGPDLKRLNGSGIR